MLRGIETAAVTMDIQFNKIDIYSHNISNAQTIGYKSQEVTTESFKDMMVQMNDGSEAPLSMGIQMSKPDIDITPGAMRHTGNSLDVAIQGKDGFFQVMVREKNPETGTMEDRYDFTRNGRFTLNKDNQLTTFSGALVIGENGPITLPLTQAESKGTKGDLRSGHIKINEYGEIFSGQTRVDQLKIISWAKSKANEDLGNIVAALKNIGEIFEKQGFAPPLDAKSAVTLDPKNKEDDVMIKQGFLEESNVNMISEMVKLMMAAKNYDMGQKMISTEDKVLDKSINEMGRLQ